jgi:hypothetical protein
MFLKRLSVLGSVLLAGCLPWQRVSGPTTTAPNCYDYSPSKTELTAWRSAIRQNTANGYRSFIKKYPRSCYVPMATAKISTGVQKTQPKMRNVPQFQTPDRSHGSY